MFLALESKLHLAKSTKKSYGVEFGQNEAKEQIFIDKKKDFETLSKPFKKFR